MIIGYDPDVSNLGQALATGGRVVVLQWLTSDRREALHALVSGEQRTLE